MKFKFLGTCAVLALAPLTASASSVTFDSCINQAFCSASVDGAQLSIFGAVNDSGTSAPFLSFGTGEIGIGSGGFTNVFQFSFDRDVTLNSFTIGTAVGLAATGFDIAGGAGSTAVSYLTDSTTANSILSVAGGLSFGANIVYTLTAEANNFNGAGAGYTAFSNWDVTVSAVPVPATLPLMLAGMGVFGAMRRRAKG